MRLLCQFLGHSRIAYAAKMRGRHVTGDLCRRCGRYLSVRVGTRAQRRRIQLGRAETA